AVDRYQGGVSIELKSNQFAAGEIAPLAPALAKYQPAGRVQAPSLRAQGNSLDALTWSGELSLSSFSFHPGERIKPVSGVNGSVRFNGDTLETSQLSARLGNSAISGRGTLTGFKSPTLSLTFYSS